MVLLKYLKLVKLGFSILFLNNKNFENLLPQKSSTIWYSFILIENGGKFWHTKLLDDVKK